MKEKNNPFWFNQKLQTDKGKISKLEDKVKKKFLPEGHLEKQRREWERYWMGRMRKSEYV